MDFFAGKLPELGPTMSHSARKDITLGQGLATLLVPLNLYMAAIYGVCNLIAKLYLYTPENDLLSTGA